MAVPVVCQFENAKNDLYSESNADISDTESCMLSESKRNKTKQNHWSALQTWILRKMWKKCLKIQDLASMPVYAFQ